MPELTSPPTHPPTQAIGRLEGHVSRRLLGLCSGDSALDTARYSSNTAQQVVYRYTVAGCRLERNAKSFFLMLKRDAPHGKYEVQSNCSIATAAAAIATAAALSYPPQAGKASTAYGLFLFLIAPARGGKDGAAYFRLMLYRLYRVLMRS